VQFQHLLRIAVTEGAHAFGAEMPSLQKGVNVVKFSNGEVKKVIVK